MGLSGVDEEDAERGYEVVEAEEQGEHSPLAQQDFE